MKKLLTILFATTLISACYHNSNEKEYTNSNDTESSIHKNAYIIDSPYGMEGIYDGKTAPEVYSIVAARAVNKMLDETRGMYESRGMSYLYIMDPKKMTDGLENGFYLSQRVTHDMIKGARAYTIVNNKNDADYYLETLISRIEPVGQDSPIIQYKLVMFDKTNKKVGEWIENIRQVRNDGKVWL